MKRMEKANSWSMESEENEGDWTRDKSSWNCGDRCHVSEQLKR